MQIAQSDDYKDNDWWEWAVWIDGTDEELRSIEAVVYTLHPTFFNPVRRVTDRGSKFRLEEAGWGTFTIYATVEMQDGKILDLDHELSLSYRDGRRTDSVLITIGNLDVVSGGKEDEFAADLREAILQAAPDVTVSDEGPKGVSIVVAKPTAFSVAKGIQDWLGRNPQATLDLSREGRSIVKGIGVGSSFNALFNSLKQG